MKSLVIPGVASALMTAAAELSQSSVQVPIPSCAELNHAAPSELVAYLEKNTNNVSRECTEFAIRELADAPDRLSLEDTQREIEALIPLMNFRMQKNHLGKSWYPARVAIAAVTNNAVQRLEDDHQDASPLRHRVVDKLIASISDTSESDLFADGATAALEQVMAFPKGSGGPLPAVMALARAAHASTDTSSSKRLWDQARKLAYTCDGGELQRRCQSALN